MHQLFRLHVLTLLVCLATPLIASTVRHVPNWDPGLAREAARAHDSQSELAVLKSALYSDEPQALMAELLELEKRDSLPWPAREAILLRFMQELRFLPAGMVPAEVMSYLAAWQPRTLVPNIHQPSVGEPLYKVREAAAGIQNGWRHDAAVNAGVVLLRERPLDFLGKCVAASAVDHSNRQRCPRRA